MPLKINLKKDQKIIINGAVLQNKMAQSISFSLLNNARVLQDKDILSLEEAATPAARVYYAVQCAYLFEDERNTHLENFNVLLSDYENAAPSCQEIATSLRGKIEKQELFPALKLARDLISHETKVLANAEQPDPKLPNNPD